MTKKFSVEFEFKPTELEFNIPNVGMQRAWRGYALQKKKEMNEKGLKDDTTIGANLEMANAAMNAFEDERFKYLLSLYVGNMLKSVEDFSKISAPDMVAISEWFDIAAGLKRKEGDEKFTKPSQ